VIKQAKREADMGKSAKPVASVEDVGAEAADALAKAFGINLVSGA